MIKEFPIIVSASMVRAILKGWKTQTRRIINQLLSVGRISEFGKSDTPGYEWHFRDRRGLWNDISHDRLLHFCCYGKPGNRLWVRETFWNEESHDSETGKRIEDDIWYRADLKPEDEAPNAIWKPSIFMPRWASRINLEIVDVRVERVQDITKDDAIAEGIEPAHVDIVKRQNWKILCYRNYEFENGEIIEAVEYVGPPTTPDPRKAYRGLWDSINAKRGFGWDVNPYVWVIEFKKL